MSYWAHHSAIIDHTALIGDMAMIWHFCHVRGIVGENTMLGYSCFVDQGAVVGANCRLQNRVSVYKGVTIGESCFIGPHVCFTNDRWPTCGNEWVCEKTFIEDHVNIGANSTIRCGIRIGQGATIGAGSVVTKDIPAGEVWYGNPARRQKQSDVVNF